MGQSAASRIEAATASFFATLLLTLPYSLRSAAFFHISRRSLLRGNLLVLGSVALSFPLAGFPNTRRDPLMALPALLALYGTFETVRCMRPRWDFYHAGVILLLWMDMMAICLILFFFFSPYLF